MARHIVCNIHCNANQDDSSTAGGTKTLVRPEDLTKQPALYKVILINDDFTPMDFVVHVLQKFFSKAGTEATQIMMQVHNQGAGIAGVYSFEIAETKAVQVSRYAHQHEHPLKCTIEKE